MTLDRCKKLMEECQAEQARAKRAGDQAMFDAQQRRYLSLLQVWGRLRKLAGLAAR